MGVRGLSTFFGQNPDLSKSYKLHDIPVIIDGNNLIYVLYFTYKVDCLYGGDYNKYAAAIKKYLSSYIACNIKPIIIFDGGYDKSDRKLKTVLQRSKARLNLTQEIVKYGKCSGKVLPIIAYEVFRSVLLEMGIPYAQCDYEADDQVTALANHYKCPVISDDSDFYIFDIANGFIRLDSIEPTVISDKNVDGEYNYLKCNIYYIDRFLSHFPGIDKSVLPLFGTLIGNDFVNISVFENFFLNIQLPKYKSGKLKVGHRQRRIVGLLCWLRHCNLNEAVNQVLIHLKKENRDYIKSLIDRAVEGYKIQNCNLTYIVDCKLEDLKRELKINTTLKTPCGYSLPIHFITEFLLGHFPSFFLNAIVLHRIFLPSQVENISLESSYVCSQFIRQILYGILLRHDILDSECRHKECLHAVEEYDRSGDRLKKKTIEPIFSLKKTGNLPKLNELYCLEKDKAICIISEVLDVKKHFFSSLPDKWQLLVGCLNFWSRNCSPGPREEFLYALIINIIYFTFINQSEKGKTKDFLEDTENKRYSHSSSAILSVILSISEADVQLGTKNLKKYLQKPVFNNGNPLILHVIHSFSQLQTCVLYIMYLNKLLGFPFKCPLIHKSFCGTMLYNLTKELLSRSFPNLFISELLGRESSLNKLFSLLKSIIFENIPTDCFIKDGNQPRKNKKKSKRSKPDEILTEKEENIKTELCNKFDSLSSLIDNDNFLEV